MASLEEIISKLEAEYKEFQERYENWEHSEAIHHLSTSEKASGAQKSMRVILRNRCELTKKHLEMLRGITPSEELQNEFVDKALKEFNDKWEKSQDEITATLTEFTLEDLLE
jgi:hypothetical protein